MLRPATETDAKYVPFGYFENLNGKISDIESALGAGVRFDTTQTLTDAQKLQGRRNIGAAKISPTDSGGSDAGMLVVY